MVQEKSLLLAAEYSWDHDNTLVQAGVLPGAVVVVVVVVGAVEDREAVHDVGVDAPWDDDDDVVVVEYGQYLGRVHEEDRSFVVAGAFLRWVVQPEEPGGERQLSNTDYLAVAAVP